MRRMHCAIRSRPYHETARRPVFDKFGGLREIVKATKNFSRSRRHALSPIEDNQPSGALNLEKSPILFERTKLLFSNALD
jgi:hypothetical protein